MSKSVLVICFTFPPTPGIGGRRWVKFAKYLKRNGHFVKVIAATSQETDISEWEHDRDELTEDITYIKSNYPRHLGIQPKTLKDKIFYKMSLFYAKTKNKGNYYDKSNYWKMDLLHASRELVKKYSITNVICTVGPFRSAFFLLQLKSEFPHINFIVDYRDPWTNNKTSFGFTSLSPRRFNYELLLEEGVLKGYDRIMAVSAEMGTYFKSFLSSKEFNSKFTSLPNGFDKEDFSGSVASDIFIKTPDKINVVFTGTFYTGSVHILKKLAEVLASIEKKHPHKKGYLHFTFVGSIPGEIKNYFVDQTHLFTYLGKKNLKETYSIIKAADFCSLFLTDDMNYSFSTKFYEYMGLQKKIMSFSKFKGANAKFIEEKKLGIAADFHSMEKVIEDLFLLPKNSFLQSAGPLFSNDSFNVQNLTKELESLLIE